MANDYKCWYNLVPWPDVVTTTVWRNMDHVSLIHIRWEVCQDFFENPEMAVGQGSYFGPAWCKIAVFKTFHPGVSEIMTPVTLSESHGIKFWVSKILSGHETKMLFYNIFWFVCQKIDNLPNCRYFSSIAIIAQILVEIACFSTS